MQGIAGQKHGKCRNMCSSLYHHHIQIHSSQNFHPMVQWLISLVVSSRAVEVGLLSDPGMEGENPTILSLQSPHCPLHDAIPAFKVFPTSGKGPPPSNTILARDSASCQWISWPLAQSRGTIDVHISDTTLGMIFLTWI